MATYYIFLNFSFLNAKDLNRILCKTGLIHLFEKSKFPITPFTNQATIPQIKTIDKQLGSAFRKPSSQHLHHQKIKLKAT